MNPPVSTGFRHTLIAAWLHVVAGVFLAGVVAVLWIGAAMLAPLFAGTFVPLLVAMVGRPIAVAALLFAALEVGAAIALMRGQGWARITIGAISALQLPIFPFGTALGLYTGWALLSAEA